MRRLVSFLTSLASVAFLTAFPAYADTGSPTTTITLSTSAPAYAGATATVTATVLDPSQQPIVGATVSFERNHGGQWAAMGEAATGADGTATVSVVLAKSAADNQVRATLVGDGTTAAIQVPLLRRRSTVTVTGPGKVVDEKATSMQIRWVAANGEPVSGPVTLLTRSGTGAWRGAATLATNAQGIATFTTTPRVDTYWFARTGTLDWVGAAGSAAYALDNLPPGRPAKLPRKAPRPKRKLPTQPRAAGAGANPVIRTIPDAVWSEMVGRTWHSGCPVGRTYLRLVEVNYWDFTGYRRRGQIAVNVDVANQVAAAFVDLYRYQIPLRSLVREDRFGWSAKLHGANDYKSMQAGNSSGFNCRGVVGNPRTRSPHAWGRAIDLDTWENPYRSARGTVPNTWWQHHSNKRYAWRSRKHLVVRLMAKHGLRWTYGLGDTQHFDAVPSGSRRADPANPATPVIRCGVAVCD
ncbi:M15 family metallopeptidase [Nocardioides sp. Kera G14]|uniref:M15 family metallopeptidase n=1 Tax=Nocardioides sp. Kera G14 TaxID=2884264 RepID=UPI001D0FA693|nr:M15 family metallopeptidase [Nocardioides sp. Kera G14]UDY22797.1 M15 family metallopeptidase [Nocardioides sp. Kera G14]